MVASLPPNIQLKLEQTLHQWRQWRCDPPLAHRPQIVSRLGSGMSNYSILVDAGQRFVIRVDGAHVVANGLSRASEWRALVNAHKAGLAPCPRYFNPELGSLVCDFLPQDKPHSPEIPKTATLLRNIHNLPALHHRLDIADRILGYERQLSHHQQILPDIMRRCRNTVVTMAIDVAKQAESPVLCHNDLLVANRIDSEGVLRAIDWEYCAMGSKWFDLAVIVIGDKLSETQKQQLVQTYLQRDSTPEESHSLEQFCLVYHYIELLWYLLNMPTKQNLETRLTGLQKQHQRLAHD